MEHDPLETMSMGDVEIYVGKCTLDEYFSGMNPCFKKFYLAYRSNPDIDCSENYSNMRACVAKATRNCLEGELSLEEVTEKVGLVVDSTLPIENAENFCDNGGFSPSPSKEEVLEYCSPSFHRKAEELEREFGQKYKRNRGSPSLCWEFEEFGHNYLDLVKQNCKETFYKFMTEQMKWVFLTREQNPCCDQQQIEEECLDSPYF